MTKNELKAIATAIRNLQIDGIDLRNDAVAQIAEQLARELAPICKNLVLENFVEDCLPDDKGIAGFCTWLDAMTIKIEPTKKTG